MLQNTQECSIVQAIKQCWGPLEWIWRPAEVLWGHCKHHTWDKRREIRFLPDLLDKGFLHTKPNWLTVLQAISEP